MSHTFFNWLMPTWHVLNLTGWGGAAAAANAHARTSGHASGGTHGDASAPPAIFVDCTGVGNAGVDVDNVPSFVREASGACANLGVGSARVTYWYGCVLNQDQRLPVNTVVHAVRRAVLAMRGGGN